MNKTKLNRKLLMKIIQLLGKKSNTQETDIIKGAVQVCRQRILVCFGPPPHPTVIENQ